MESVYNFAVRRNHKWESWFQPLITQNFDRSDAALTSTGDAYCLHGLMRFRSTDVARRSTAAGGWLSRMIRVSDLPIEAHVMKLRRLQPRRQMLLRSSGGYDPCAVAPRECGAEVWFVA